MGDLEDEAMAKVLLVGQDQLLMKILRGTYQQKIHLRYRLLQVDLRQVFGRFSSDCIVVDYAIGRIDAQQICQNLRRNAEYSETIVMHCFHDGSQITVDRNHVNESFKKPFDVALLVRDSKHLSVHERTGIKIIQMTLRRGSVA